MPPQDSDSQYKEVFLTPLRECLHYVPQLGGNTEQGINLDRFQTMYGADPLYSWIGLDSPAMYAAHKAAGGITSVYRQLGIGCERLARAVFRDALHLSHEQLLWGYDVVNDGGRVSRITLDAKIDLIEVSDIARRDLIQQWIVQTGTSIGITPSKCALLRGAVFEVRQGYKSADSKRQNADLRSALKASQQDFLPIVMVISSQINSTVQRRYTSSGLSIMVGKSEGPITKNTFTFYRDVIGYDLAAFFDRNKDAFRSEVQAIVSSLLSA